MAPRSTNISRTLIGDALKNYQNSSKTNVHENQNNKYDSTPYEKNYAKPKESSATDLKTKDSHQNTPSTNNQTKQLVDDKTNTLNTIYNKNTNKNSLNNTDSYTETFRQSSKYLKETQTIGYNSKEIYHAPDILKNTATKAQKAIHNLSISTPIQTLKNSTSNLSEITQNATGIKNITTHFENALDKINQTVSNSKTVQSINDGAKNIRNSIQTANPLVETRVIATPNGTVILNTAKSKSLRTISMAIRGEGAQAAGKLLGRVAIAYGIFDGTKKTVKAFKKEGKTAGVIEGGKQTGGVVGAYVGGKIGVAIGAPILPPAGAIVGGLVGGAVGYVAGSGVGKKIGQGAAIVGKAVVKNAKITGKAIVNKTETLVKHQVNIAKSVTKTGIDKAKKIVSTQVKTAVKNTARKYVKLASKITPTPIKNVAKKVTSWIHL